MTKHSMADADVSIFDRQDTLPKKAAAKLDYETGFALGKCALRDDGAWLGPLLIDARVLTARHGSCAVAGVLMGVAGDGLRGLLHGAGYHLEAGAAVGAG